MYIWYYLKVCLLNTHACCGRFLLCTPRQRAMTSTRQSASPGLNGCIHTFMLKLSILILYFPHFQLLKIVSCYSINYMPK